MTPIILERAAEDDLGFHPHLWLSFAVVVLVFISPLSFAYAVVKHRVLDIPVLLRRSARYFMVERGFAILIFVISVAATLGLAEAFSHHFSSGSKAAIPVGGDVWHPSDLGCDSGASPSAYSTRPGILPQFL